MEWTTDTVKRDLPDVTLRRPDRSLVVARLGGRRKPFAQALTPNGGSVEVSWSTVASCLNRGVPVQL